jgi:hypothetical protein
MELEPLLLRHCAYAGVLAAGLVFGPPALAAQDMDLLKGVGTVSWSAEIGDAAPLTDEQFGRTVEGGLKKIFTKTAVKAASLAPPNDPAALEIHFALSVRAEGKMKLATLVAEISRHGHAGAAPVAYPFIVPQTTGEVERKVEDGVLFLFSYLPAYMDCADGGNCAHHGDPYVEQQGPR